MPSDKKEIEEQILEEEETQQIQQFIESALRMKLADLSDREIKDTEVEALVDVLNEFLSCYILIGYDFEGEPVTLSYALNTKDSNSLSSLLMKFLPVYFGSNGFDGTE